MDNNNNNNKTGNWFLEVFFLIIFCEYCAVLCHLFIVILRASQFFFDEAIQYFHSQPFLKTTFLRRGTKSPDLKLRIDRFYIDRERKITKKSIKKLGLKINRINHGFEWLKVGYFRLLCPIIFSSWNQYLS